MNAQQTQLPLDTAADHSRPTNSTRRIERHGRVSNSMLVAPPRHDPEVSPSVSRPTTPAPMLLTVRDVEAELQLGRTRTYELLRSGVIPVVRVGRVLRVPRDALRRWIDENCTSSDFTTDGGDFTTR
jgi:excisionase family DNA binding protein